MRTKRETQFYVILYREDTVVGDFYDEEILLAVPHVQTSSTPGKIMFCFNVWFGFKKKAERKKELFSETFY
jgi:hypothetical protein